MSSKKTTTCPYCGATILARATACPECGSDEQTGWSDSTYLDGIDLPDNGDYEESLRKEFGAGADSTPGKISWVTMVGAAALVVLVWLLFRGVV